MKKILLVVLIVFVMGCTNVNIPLSDPVSVERKTNEENLKDVLTIESVDVIPSQVYPNELFRMVIKIKNNDGRETVHRFNVDLFDTSVFTLLNTSDCSRDNCVIPPKGEKEIVFELRAPGPSYVQGESIQGTLSYRITYAFLGMTTYEIPIVNYNEILKAERAQKRLSIMPTKTITDGPVVVDVGMVDRNYALSKKTAMLKFQVFNKGSGNIKKSVILPGAFKISFNSLGDATALSPGTFDYSEYDIVTGKGPTGSFIEELYENIKQEVKEKAKEAVASGLRHVLGVAGESFEEVYDRLKKRYQNYFQYFDILYKGVDKAQIAKSPDIFQCDNSGCVNHYYLPLYKGKSSPMIFKLKDLPEVAVYKNYPLYTGVFYEYELRGTRTITVRTYGG